MERGLIAFEQKKILPRFNRWLSDLRERGVTPKFGGMGEGSGLGGGAMYEHRFGEANSIQFTALVTFKNYQEADLRWRTSLPGSAFLAEASWQWRPQENYYGYGHESLRSERTSFALGQTWAGVRFEIYPHRRLRIGVLDRVSWTVAKEGRNSFLPRIAPLFPGLPGYESETRLNSTGVYMDLDGITDEYSLGGAAHGGVSLQRSFGSENLRYLAIESRLEGRTPVKRGNSVVVGQANLELNRELSGSSAIPFYLQPRVGGSATLRGYPLDRFYGRGLMVLSLEYRIRAHPNLQFYPFLDEGQIFDRTEDLSWLNWHRTYGFGFRVRSPAGTLLRLDFAWGGEGTQVHIVFGDREQPPLRSAVRYGGYKR
jgi:outer membrane protein assembly factor BamA